MHADLQLDGDAPDLRRLQRRCQLRRVDLVCEPGADRQERGEDRRGFVKSLVAWTFFYHPTYTQVMKFVVSQIAKGTTIVMTCQGNGCAFASLTLTPGHKRQSLNLLARFAHRKLKPGARVTVRVTHPNWVGKFFSFTIRGGAAPLVA